MAEKSQENTPPEAVGHMSSHVLSQLATHRSLHNENQSTGNALPPLIVGVQGPQGSGKTFLTSLLRDALQSAPHKLSVAVFSLDDLYLPHDGLVALASAHPHNPLFKGRGQPGTHDVPLGTQILNQLRRVNDSTGADARVQLPSFDKSLFSGEGDRSASGAIVRPPVDVVLFEGWCVGFYPISRESIERRFAHPVTGIGEGFFSKRGYKVEDVLEINERLRSYVSWWELFDAFIQIKPPEEHPYDFIYKWRLQQEHHMKARNGGRGMTDEQVEAFVDRYIPGYVFFGDGVTEGYEEEPGHRKLPPWIGHGLRIHIGEFREVLNVHTF